MEIPKINDHRSSVKISQKKISEVHLFDGKEDTIFAGFFIRLAALIIDSMVYLSLYYAAVFLVANIILGTSAQSFIEKQGSLLHILNYLIYSIYFTTATYIKGCTFGKFIFNLRVVHADPNRKRSFGQIFFREFIGKWISVLILYMGFIPAFVGGKNKHRTLHDYIVNTLVIKKNS
ncbi:RDD family protein [Bacteriovoracaceae bacterium]|nr:RDD family protein [Bacteriovoracaceae bacterium]